MYLLEPEEIGDNIDLDLEGKYPCLDGSTISTLNVDKLLLAQAQKTARELQRFGHFEEVNIGRGIKETCFVIQGQWWQGFLAEIGMCDVDKKE